MSNCTSNKALRAAALLLAAAVAGAHAAAVPFVGVLDIATVEATNSEWIVTGSVRTYPPAGYTGLNVSTNCMLGCEFSAGTLDLYQVTAVVTQTAAIVSLQVAYDGAGSPSAGAPTFGTALLCDAVDGIPLTADYLPQGASPFLRDAMRWAGITRLAEATTAGGVEEAPADGSAYARSNGTWTVVNTTGGSGGTTVNEGFFVFSGGAIVFNPSGSPDAFFTTNGSGGVVLR